MAQAITPGQAVLTVKKVVECQASGTANPAAVCAFVTSRVTPASYTMQVLSGGTVLGSFPGSPAGTVIAYGGGVYEVSETGPNLTPLKNLLGAASVQLVVSFTGNCTHLRPQPKAIGSVSPNGSHICTAVNTIKVSGGAVPPQLNIADASVTEGNSGTTPINFTITPTFTPTVACQLTATVVNGSTDSADLTPATTVNLNVPAGATAPFVTFNVVGDTVVESNETFTVQISGSGTNPCLIGDSSGAGTIVNDDVAQPAISIADRALDEGSNGNDRSFAFSVTTITPVPATCGFRATLVLTSTDTASLGDFVSTAPVQHFLGGGSPTGGFFSMFTSVGDNTVEPNETFTVQITSSPQGSTPGCVIGDGTATGTIVNDDTAPAVATISIADVQQVEGTGTNDTLRVTLNKTNLTTGNCGFRLTLGIPFGSDTISTGDFVDTTSLVRSTSNGTATATQSTFEIVADSTVEPDERFTLTIVGEQDNVNPPCNIGDASADGVLLNDDVAAPLRTITSITAAGGPEGDSGTTTRTFVLNLDGPAVGNESVRVDTTDGTANAGSDYVAIVNQTVTFAAGATSASVNVLVNGDTTPEINESFGINLTNPQNVIIGDSQGIVAIGNDD